MINMKTISFASLASTIFVGSASPTLPRLPFTGGTVDLGTSHATCAKRAGAAIASEIVVDKIDKGPNGATAYNKHMVIYCTSKGSNKSEAIIFVAGDKGTGKQTNETMQQLRDAMKSGIFE